jgi:ectoine hydroxylase-related dioxygenase (phytanoyl-CoA dioxygenase family)
MKMETDQQELLRTAERDGYVYLKNVVSKEKLAKLNDQLVAAYQQARQTGELFAGGGSISGHLNCFPGEGARFVLDDLRSHGVLDLVRNLAPAAVDRLRVNCNFNLPGSVAQHYHTDGYFTDSFYLCTIAVIDTDVTNGAMDVLPGTHQRYYKFWEYALQRKYRLTTRVPMKQGDVVLRKNTLWHRGMPNLTSAPRPVLTFTFGEKSAPTSDPFLVRGGKIYFEPNWFKTDRIGRIRERIFVTSPFTYSAYRFVRSLYGQKGFAPE